MALTDSICKNIKPTDKVQKLTDGKGLYLQIPPSGAKYWRLKYRFGGKEKLLALGVYPETTLLKAREKREEARKLLLENIDPSETKKEIKRVQTLNNENTFEAIAREWHATNLSKWIPAHGGTILTRLERDIFPKIGHKPIVDILAPDILNAIRFIEKRGAIEIAHRMLQYCTSIFGYAIATGRCERNPAQDIKGALMPVKRGHYRSLDPKLMAEFIDKLDKNEARLFPHTRLAVKLMMLTFVRTGELIGAKWGEIDFKEQQWLIPPERMKMRKAHIVPLCTQSIAILEELKAIAFASDFIFPSQIRSNKHMSNNTILKAIERLGFKEETTGHGFRALAMTTIKEKLNYRHEVIDRQLAHSHKNKIDAAYDRAQFLDERKKMMQEWGDYIEKLR
jgi:integrase